MHAEKEEAWITGIGIVSTLGDGCEANWQALAAGRPAVDQMTFSPSVVHKVTGSSRTFLGEEAGLEALRTARARVIAGQSDVVLVGGAQNGERKDVLLFCEAGGLALKNEFAPVFERQAGGGGIAPGSFGAFLVIESRSHATTRGAQPFARLASVACQRTKRERGGVTRSFDQLWQEMKVRASG